MFKMLAVFQPTYLYIVGIIVFSFLLWFVSRAIPEYDPVGKQMRFLCRVPLILSSIAFITTTSLIVVTGYDTEKCTYLSQEKEQTLIEEVPIQDSVGVGNGSYIVMEKQQDGSWLQKEYPIGQTTFEVKNAQEKASVQTFEVSQKYLVDMSKSIFPSKRSWGIQESEKAPKTEMQYKISVSESELPDFEANPPVQNNSSSTALQKSVAVAVFIFLVIVFCIFLLH